MLRALGTPLSFLGLLVGFLLAVVVQAYATAFAARTLGDRQAYRRLGGVRRVLDPFGAVAAALGGLGWGVLPELPLRSRGRLAVALLAGPIAVALCGVVALVLFVLVGGSRFVLGQVGLEAVISGVSGEPAQQFFFSLGIELLGIAVLSLVPLPPLVGWRLLELASTGSVGWQRAREYLVDKNLGVLALLVLIILPLGGSAPLLVVIVDRALSGLLGLAV